MENCIKYDKLWKLCENKSINKLSLFIELGMSTQTLNQMRNNKTVSLKTIDKLCTYFNCQPDDIMEVDND